MCCLCLVVVAAGRRLRRCVYWGFKVASHRLLFVWCVYAVLWLFVRARRPEDHGKSLVFLDLADHGADVPGDVRLGESVLS